MRSCNGAKMWGKWSCRCEMNKAKTILLPLLVMVLWGSLFPCVKLGYAAYGVATTGDILLFAGLRFTLCGGLICLFALCKQRNDFQKLRQAWIPTLCAGLFAIILHYGFTYTGLLLTDSSKTAILKQIGALLYVCCSFLFFREDRLTLPKLLGAGLGFCGILSLNLSAEGFSFHIGDLLILAASFCTVFSNVIGKKALQAVAPVPMTGVSQLFGGLVLSAVGWCMGGRITWNPSKWYIFAYICVASVVSYCIWYGAVQKGELSRLFILKFAEPVFACIFGALLLKENILRWQYLAAFLLISFGILVSHFQRKKTVSNC